MVRLDLKLIQPNKSRWPGETFEDKQSQALL